MRLQCKMWKHFQWYSYDGFTLIELCGEWERPRKMNIVWYLFTSFISKKSISFKPPSNHFMKTNQRKIKRINTLAVAAALAITMQFFFIKKPEEFPFCFPFFSCIRSLARSTRITTSIEQMHYTQSQSQPQPQSRHNGRKIKCIK